MSKADHTTNYPCSTESPVYCREEESSSWKGRSAWGLVSIAGIGLSWVVSVTFPYFSTVMAIIAALGDLAGAYALPALFVLVRVPSFMADAFGLAVA